QTALERIHAGVFAHPDPDHAHNYDEHNDDEGDYSNWHSFFILSSPASVVDANNFLDDRSARADQAETNAEHRPAAHAILNQAAHVSRANYHQEHRQDNRQQRNQPAGDAPLRGQHANFALELDTLADGMGDRLEDLC